MMVARRAPAADPDGLTGAARTPRPAPGDAESAAPAPDSARAAPPQVRLLGPPSLASDTDEAPLPPERRTRLLAYLACRRTWVTRDSLLALFWPDRDPSSARNNLRYVLLQARRLRGLDNLEVRGEALRWPVETDLHRFESAVAAGDWAGAIAWYRGPLLEGFEADAPPPFAEWLDFERARLAASWRESIHRRLADPTLVAGGRAELAARLLRDDPLDQAAMAALMRAQDQLGQAALAVDAYRHYAARLRAELGVEPAAALRDLARRIEAGGAGAAPDAPLPRAPEDRADESDEIVGRRTELAQIAQFLGAADCRVLTLTGPGGIGKSRLARAARARLQAHFPDGVWWVGLEDLQNVTQVVARCAAIAGVPLAAQTDPVQVLVRQLAQRNALLLLDNSEHLPELGSFVATLVRECSGIKVLATSRARLGCSGEWLLPLDGLAVPDEGESDVGVLRAFDAVRLFELRARTARFDFDLVRDALAVNELVRQVEGMPLALELAAAWVRLLPVREIARELRHSLELLDMPQGQSARERGMRASFAHSWAMLAPAEQRALAALSVFTGSFTHAAARHVAEAPLPLLAALADKSLVRADDDGRFSLHALIRQCAAERLAQDPAANDAVLARHAAWFAHTMQQFHSFHAIDHAAALRTIAAELPNVLAAWDWSLQHEDVGFLATCAPGLGNYFQMRGPAQQGLALFEAAEQVMQDAGPVAGDARWILPLERASLHHSLGQYALLEQAARRALKGARACRDAFGIRTSLNSIAIALQRQGRAAEADRYLGEALRRARHAGAVNEIPYYAANLATNRFALGRDDDATQLIQESLAQYQANRQQIGVMQALGELGTYCVVQGRTREAIDWLERGLQVATEAGVATRRCHFLGMLAQACIDLGDIAGAQQYAERARLSFEASREPSQEAAVRRALAEVALATGDLAAAGSHLRLAAAAVQRNRSPLQVIPLVRTFAVWLQRRGGAQPALLWTCWADRQSPRTPVSVTVRRALEAIRARHAPADIDAAEAAARARSLDDAIGAMTERLAEAAY